MDPTIGRGGDGPAPKPVAGQLGEPPFVLDSVLEQVIHRPRRCASNLGRAHPMRITFKLPPEPPQPTTGFRLDGDPWSWLRRGVGVTAADVDDALAIIHAELDRYGEIPAPAEIVYDVDVSTLDEHHILPNIGPVVWRGIWWPPGFTQWKGD